MANSAPMTVYQGSRQMKRKYEGSKADEKRDRRSGRSERSSVERSSDKAEASSSRDSSATKRSASKTILGRTKTPRVTRSQTSFGGDDIGS